MMDEVYFKRIMTSVLLILLIVLSFFLVKPILLSIISGFLLAFVFSPVYDWVYKKTKSKNLSASLISIFLILIIVLPFWFFMPVILEQSFGIYQAIQSFDFVTPLKTIFPSLFTSEGISKELVSILYTFTTNTANYISNAFGQLLLDLPELTLQFLVMAFTFFYVLRDKDELIIYIKSLLPFSKEVENKIFEYSRGITFSVIYGEIIVGILQGIAVGLGLYLFNVPNALFLTLVAVVFGILPIIGTTIVWLLAAIYVLISQGTLPAIGVSIFGIISNFLGDFLRPIIIAKRIKINSALMLIGMIGGVLLFGILGTVLGPLIIGYLLILLEAYRNKKMPSILLQPSEQAKD